MLVNIALLRRGQPFHGLAEYACKNSKTMHMVGEVCTIQLFSDMH
jgi:hypothetical protein